MKNAYWRITIAAALLCGLTGFAPATAAEVSLESIGRAMMSEELGKKIEEGVGTGTKLGGDLVQIYETWEEFSDAHDALTPDDRQFDPDYSPPGSPEIPSACAESEECNACYEKAVKDINFYRFSLDKGRGIANGTIQYANKAIAFGDTASASFGVGGLKWSLDAKPDIEKAVTKLRKTYKSKYEEWMQGLENPCRRSASARKRTLASATGTRGSATSTTRSWRIATRVRTDFVQLLRGRWSRGRCNLRRLPACAQPTLAVPALGLTALATSEDCLYLNVWTAAKRADERRPVMVWIHGGSFMYGTPSYPVNDGTHLAQAGVVVVGIAYRLGPFGFLAHPALSRESGRASGNFGLQDQIAALRWVKANIAKFGGDPANVTIIGASSGGMSASLLSISPQAKGLFQKVIAESGAVFGPTRFEADSRYAAENLRSLALAESAGRQFLSGLGVADVEAGRRLSADVLLNAAVALPTWPPFWPVLDDDVLPGNPYELYKQGRINDTPVLVGSNSNDNPDGAPPGATPALLEQALRAGPTPQTETILSAYPHETDSAAVAAFQHISRDAGYAWHVWTWARLHSQTARNKAYLYYFDARAPGAPDGAGHGAEVPYIFGTMGMAGDVGGYGREPRKSDVAVSNLMRQYWINFARTGNPNGPSLPEWPAFDASAEKALVIGEHTSASAVPNLPQLQVWDGYFTWRREQQGKRGAPSAPVPR